MNTQDQIEEKDELVNHKKQQSIRDTHINIQLLKKIPDRSAKLAIAQISIGSTLLIILWLWFQQDIFQMFHFHFSSIYQSQTVAIPFAGSTFNFSTVKEREKYTFDELLIDLVKPFNDSTCELVNIKGSILCQNVLQKSEALLNFGYNKEDNFGCQLALSYSIISYHYGCSNQQVQKCENNSISSGNCLGEVSQNVSSKAYISIPDVIRRHQLEKQHIIMKIVVKKQNDWASFRSLPLTYLEQVDQIILECYIDEGYYWGTIDIFQSLFNRFFPVNFHMNNQFCYSDQIIEQKVRRLQSPVFQITYVNRNLIKLNSDSRSLKVNQENTKSFPGMDCQMPHQPNVFQITPITLIQTTKKEKNFHLLSIEHVHIRTSYPYPTLGAPIQGNFFKLNKIQQDQRVNYHTYITELLKPYNDTNCEYARYGDISDQGYVLCKNVVKNSVALLNMGIQGRDAFGCQLTSQFDIPNFQFDCTNNQKPYCRSNNVGNIFEYACVGERSEVTMEGQLKFYSIKDIIDSHNLKGKHITLKIDIEGGQWSGLRSLPLDYLDFIDQIVMEIHLFEQFGYFQGNKVILEKLMEKFYPVNFHMNNYNCWRKKTSLLPSTVFEVTLVNNQVLKLHSKSRSFALHQLNKPNSFLRDDCQILNQGQ